MSRCCARRRTTSVNSPRPTCAASAWRPHIPPISARSRATASRPTGPGAPRRAIPRLRRHKPRRNRRTHHALRADRHVGRRPDLPSFWRPATATVRIGDRVETALHLLQVWMIRPMGGEKMAVLYPQDGYSAPAAAGACRQGATAFGSSFLIGPVEVERRPSCGSGGRVRPALAHLHATIRARRDRAREDGGHR